MTLPKDTQVAEGLEELDVEVLIRAISNVEWRWMENEGRFPAPSRSRYAAGLRKQITGMTNKERWTGPMSNENIVAEYRSLLSQPEPER